MKEHSRFVGLDVHAETIAVAVAERGGTEPAGKRMLKGFDEPVALLTVERA